MKYVFFLIAIATFSLMSCSDNATTSSGDPPEFTNANGIKGGILFDKYWSVESGYDQSSPKLTTFNASADFFRCKQCHAWDLMGKNGSYINRAPKTNRPNVADRNLFQTSKQLTAQELFDALKNGLGHTRRSLTADLTNYNPSGNSTIGDQMPNLLEIFTDAQIWDIVKFLKVEALDVTKLYDATYEGTYPTGKATYTNIGKDGDAVKGLTFYKANCESCHGADGNAIQMENMGVGKFTRSKPYEVQHKVKFGQLGSTMKPTAITATEMKDLYKALADTEKFPN